MRVDTEAYWNTAKANVVFHANLALLEVKSFWNALEWHGTYSSRRVRRASVFFVRSSAQLECKPEGSIMRWFRVWTLWFLTRVWRSCFSTRCSHGYWLNTVTSQCLKYHVLKNNKLDEKNYGFHWIQLFQNSLKMKKVLYLVQVLYTHIIHDDKRVWYAILFL